MPKPVAFSAKDAHDLLELLDEWRRGELTPRRHEAGPRVIPPAVDAYVTVSSFTKVTVGGTSYWPGQRAVHNAYTDKWSANTWDYENNPNTDLCYVLFPNGEFPPTTLLGRTRWRATPTGVASDGRLIYTVVTPPWNGLLLVDVTTTAALPAYTGTQGGIQANANGAMPAIDGVTPTVGLRFLHRHGPEYIAGLRSSLDNLIFEVTAVGDAGSKWSARIVPTGAVGGDANSQSDAYFLGLLVEVTRGNRHARSLWQLGVTEPNPNSTVISIGFTYLYWQKVPRFSGAAASRSTLTVGDNTWTTLELTSEAGLFDTDDYHDTGTNPSRFSGNEPDWFLAGAEITWAASAAGARQAELFLTPGGTIVGKNDVTPLGGGVLPTTMQVVSYPFGVGSGDYFELRVRQTSGGNLDLTSARMWLARLGHR